jgi:hypothetical protein
MIKVLFNHQHWILFCMGVLMLMSNSASGDGDQASRVKKLVEESSAKKTASESGLLNSNPLMPNDLAEALAYIKKHPDYTSYHLLLAIRKYYADAYKDVTASDKDAILCSALKNSTHLNDWGYLDPAGSFDGVSAKALLENGKAALKSLAAGLADGESAPLFGTEEATISKLYHYRRKDFAYRYASLILGLTPSFHADPKERDKDINKLKIELAKKNLK